MISTEIELKLAADPGDLARLTCALRARALGAAATPQRLVSTYFDTSDCTLRRAGSTLRVRDQNGRFVQSLKTGDPDGTNLLARGEWEDPVASDQPDAQAPASGSHLPPDIASALHPVFVTEVERTTIEISPEPGTRIEAAVDRGVIRTAADRRSEPVSEIELELKEGDPAALYDLALELVETAPLSIELRSKSERGYRLLEPAIEPPSVAAGRALALAAEISLEEVLQRVGRACLAHLLRSTPAALAGKIEGIHQMRVAMRRLRSMLSAVKTVLPESERRWAVDEIKALTEALGPARNLDVFATELLAPAREAAPDQPGWNELTAACETARAAAYARVLDGIRSPRFTASLLRLLRWFEGRGWRQSRDGVPNPALSVSIGAAAPAVLDRRRRAVRKRSRRFGRLSAQRRHRLRIAVKKLRYALELLDSLYDPDDARRFVKRLKRVQDGLGHANDVRVAYRLVIELGRSAPASEAIADAGAQMLAQHQRGLSKSEAKLRRHLRRLNRTPRFWRG